MMPWDYGGWTVISFDWITGLGISILMACFVVIVVDFTVCLIGFFKHG